MTVQIPLTPPQAGWCHTGSSKGIQRCQLILQEFKYNQMERILIKTHDRCLLQEIRWRWRWFQNTSFTLSNKQQIFEIPIPLKTVYIYINHNDISDSPWLISCLSISKHNTTTQRHTLSAGTSKTSLLIKEIKKP